MSEKMATVAADVPVTDRFMKTKKRYFLWGILLMAALVVVNVAVYMIPSRYTTVKTNPMHPATLSDASHDFVKEIDEDVTVYVLSSDGSMETSFKRLLDAYKAANSHISLSMVNTTSEPDFAAKYTEEKLTDYSLIVVGSKRHAVLAYTDLFYYVNAYINHMASSATDIRMSLEDVYYWQSMGNNEILSGMATYGFEIYSQAEGMITSALDYVTQENPAKDYVSPYADMEGMLVSTEYLSDLSVVTVLVWGLVIALVIPVGILVTGFVIWLRRRKY